MKTFDEFVNESHYKDLTPYVYGDTKGYKNVVNIGWLNKGQPYDTGNVPPDFVKKLRNMETVANHKGSHHCPFCEEKHSISSPASSSTVHAVKGDGVVYFCPGLIKHYISKHGYKPPQEFIDAVMNIQDKEKERHYKSGW